MVAATMHEKFSRSVEIAAPVAVVWAFHERPDALQRLIPPWQRVELVSSSEPGLQAGKRVVLRQRVGPVWLTMRAVHVEYEEGRLFADKVEGGPFSYWLHRHLFAPTADGGCRLTDELEYSLRGGALGRLVVGRWFRGELEKMFAFRHAVTKKECEAEVRRAGPA
jgi:ligand-binding SRPBCC domain-containing protein